MGLCLVIVGSIGSLVFGYMLDDTHKFKEIATWVCKLGGLAMGIFCLTLEARSKKILFVTTFILG